ncbi:septin-12-like isoform X2 [Heliangelus exortis]|uniref:septin-12-like isoform X2 n=1 Tax=Heliangelus exortis TaxID=472823 RepID=UPI003A929531
MCPLSPCCVAHGRSLGRVAWLPRPPQLSPSCHSSPDGSSLESQEHSMEPPAVLEEEEEEEEMPLTVASGPVGHQLFGYVGIEAVLEQMKIKTMKMGFEFNIMVVGQSGLGKSTMVNTLFKSKVSPKSSQPGQEGRIPQTVQLQSITHVIEEKGVKMKLTVTDTPGFGDQINNENCWDPIIKYINEQYERYLREEILIARKRKIPDTRVHGCVYFVPPTGHWLRPLDLEFMRRLSKIVNVVPVIAKADTLTLEERAEFKQRIQEDLKTHAISVYPQEDFDQDPDDRALNDRIREKIPFAVVGADQEHQVNGKRVLGRKTKWGIIEVENPAHCEFPLLQDLLIRSHLQDLKDITHNVHYESYRVRRLNESNRVAQGPRNGLPGKEEGGSHP